MFPNHLESPQLTLTRQHYTADGIFGQWLDADGRHLCFTLEHAFEDQGAHRPLLPAGEYVVIWGTHTLTHDPRPFMTYEFPPFVSFDGQMHTKVLAAHVGNLNRDSEGCVLVGDSQNLVGDTPASINASREAFGRFIAAIGGHQTIRVRVVDSLEVQLPPILEPVNEDVQPEQQTA